MFKIFGSKKKNLDSETRIIGVTGSHGKTMLTHLISHILTENGLNVATLSSVGELKDGSLNERKSINKLKKKAIENFLEDELESGRDFIILEMPFSQIYRGYFDSVEIDSGAITYVDNLFDSVDFWNISAEAILSFIKSISHEGLLVANTDNPEASQILSEIGNQLEQNVFCFWSTMNDISSINPSISGVSYTTSENEFIETQLHGERNSFVSYLAMKICSRYLGVEQIKNSIKSFSGIKGRLDLVNYDDKHFFIDNSKHFDHIAENLKYIHKIKNPDNRIFVVMGQDEKRNQVIPQDLNLFSDVILLAANDPNNLHTSDINSELFNQLETHGSKLIERINSSDELAMIDKRSLKNKLHLVNQSGDSATVAFDAHDYTSRLDAIKLAKEAALAGDFILISGKGNEDYLVFNNAEYEWSDYEALDLVHKGARS